MALLVFAVGVTALFGKTMPSITWANPADITYSTALNTNDQLNATANMSGTNVPGTFAYNPPVGTVLVAGANQTLSVTFTPEDTSSYDVATASVTLTVLPQALTITASAQSKIYGTALSLGTTAFSVGSGLVGSEAVTAVTLTAEGGTNATDAAGSYTITPSAATGTGGFLASNYDIAYATGTLAVTQAVLTVTADSLSRAYGAANPTLTYSISGFVNEETLASSGVTGSPNLWTTADANSTVAGSPYPITVTGGAPGNLSAANYSFTYVNGSLAVTPYAVTITARDRSKTYGETVTFAGTEFTTSGLQNGDSVSSVTLTAEGGTNATDAAGSYTIMPSAATGSGLANYSIAYHNGALTVYKANPSVTTWPTASAITYGQTLADSTLSGGSATPAGSFAFTTPSTAPNAGTASQSVTYAPTDTDNYNTASGTVSVTVNTASSSLAIGSSANPSPTTSNVTFTATLSAVSPGAGTPTGDVTFKDGSTSLGTGTLNGSGVATFSTTSLAHGTRTITAEYAGDGNFNGSTGTLSPNQVINTPPVALADIIPRVPPYGTRVPISVLLTNDSDADGDEVVFDTVAATSAADGTLSQTNGWIFYTPPAGFTNEDSFTYTVRDGLGGFATGTVAVAILADRGTSARLTLTNLGNGTFQIVSAGVPWGNYTIQFTENLRNQTNQYWEIVAVGTADLWGNFVVDDVPPMGTQARFYRASYEGDGNSSLPFRFALNSSVNPALPGSTVTFTASCTPFAQGNVIPSGTNQFKVDGTNYGAPVTLTNGNASLSINLLWGAHRISAEYSGDTNYRSAICALSRPQVINTPPVATNVFIQRDPSHGMKVLVSDLLTNASDVDTGDSLVLGISSTSVMTGALSQAEGWVFYTPPAGFVGPDSFTYTVRDSLGATATATVANDPPVGNEAPSANLTSVNLSNGTYRIVGSGIPWRIYTIQYTTNLGTPNWQSIATNTADSHGLFEHEDTWPLGTPPRSYRSVSQFAGPTASPFRLAVWTNFIGHTNGRVMDMWTKLTANNPPELAWNTNCLLYGLDGFTGISQRNEFDGGNAGQVPVTLLTRRHGYTRGHGFPGTNGLCTTLLAGQRVWFCTASNTVVQMTVAAEMDRLGFVDVPSPGGNSYDYGLVVFTNDVPESISPVSVMSPADLEIYYWNTPDLPYMFLTTGQGGQCAAGVPPFTNNIKLGDSGSPNMIPSPDNKLIMFSGVDTSGFSPQMQKDIDRLSVCVGLNTNNYQLRWYDLSPWGP